MARTEKFKAAMKIRGMKVPKLAELYGVDKSKMSYIIGKELYTKEEIDKLAEILELTYTSQFVIGGKTITGISFTAMIKELMEKTGTSYAVLADKGMMHSRQNAFERVSKGRFIVDDLQNIAIACGGFYEEIYYLDGIEL